MQAAVAAAYGGQHTAQVVANADQAKIKRRTTGSSVESTVYMW
jgi:hypothetical protein